MKTTSLYNKTYRIRNLQKMYTFHRYANVVFIISHEHTRLDKHTSLLKKQICKVQA